MGCNLLGPATMRVYDISPVIAGAFLGALWQVFVIFGFIGASFQLQSTT